MRARSRSLTALAVSAVLLGGCSADDSEPRPGDAVRVCRCPASASPTSLDAAADDGSVGRGGTAPEVEAEERERAVRPVSVLGLAEQRHRGDRLRLGAVRERTPEYTSYDVTYRSRTTTRKGEESYTITGVLNVPTGRGDFRRWCWRTGTSTRRSTSAAKG